MGGDDVYIARQIINLDDDALLVDFAKAPVSPKSVEADRNICEINSVSVAFTPQNKHFKIAVFLLIAVRQMDAHSGILRKKIKRMESERALASVPEVTTDNIQSKDNAIFVTAWNAQEIPGV